jgi:carbon-monoxide dehydrogenase large subunit
MPNPMIVDGQILGGIAQGIGTALYEEIPYDASSQPLATSFADYLMPCAPDLPNIRIAHAVTPARATEYGVQRRRGRVPGDRGELQRDAADAAAIERARSCSPSPLWAENAGSVERFHLDDRGRVIVADP